MLILSQRSAHSASRAANRALVVVMLACGLPLSARTIAVPPGSHSAPEVVGPEPQSGADPFAARLAINPDDPAVKAYAAAQKRRLAVERELKLIRTRHFGTMQNVEIRQAGIAKLRAFTDAAVFPSLLALFEQEGRDVRAAVLDHLTDQRTEQADATLAWAAVFDADEWFRTEATKRLLERTGEPNARRVPNSVKSAVAQGLRSSRESEVAAGAQLALRLRLYEAIPMLINAQVVGGGSGAAGGGGGETESGDRSLAYILVGTQQAFVSDLTPVVGDSAVGFDPQLSVLTEGTYLRVIDAYVITYRVDVHNALVGLADAGWDGRSTKPLGWDGKAWREWYAVEFRPYRARVDAGADGATSQGG